MRSAALSASVLCLAISILGLAAQATRGQDWSVDGPWVLRPNGAEGERFFAVGLWYIPFLDPGDPSTFGKIGEAAEVFNLIKVHKHHLGLVSSELGDFDTPVLETGLDVTNAMFRDNEDNDAGPCIHVPRSRRCSGDPVSATRSYGKGGYIADELPEYMFEASFSCKYGPLDYDGVQAIRRSIIARESIFDGPEGYIQKYIMKPIHDAAVAAAVSDAQLMWLLADEPDITVNGWARSPEIVAECDRATKAISGALSYVGLYAVAGSMLTFEQIYEEEHGTLPATKADLPILPGEVSGKVDRAWRGSRDHSESYRFMRDGKSRFRHCDERPGSWDINGSYWYDRNYGRVFETVSALAGAYDESCDIMGLNNYYLFHLHPRLAGVCVDAIEAGRAGEKPIWLFFDGCMLNLQKQANLDIQMVNDYARNVECQIYTSIAHGATGVKFFTLKDPTFPDPETGEATIPAEFAYAYWDSIQEICRRLQDRMSILTADEVASGAEGDTHYSVREVIPGSYFIIATNTSRTEILDLDLPFYRPSRDLQPLEIRISELPPHPFLVAHGRGGQRSGYAERLLLLRSAP